MPRSKRKQKKSKKSCLMNQNQDNQDVLDTSKDVVPLRHLSSEAHVIECLDMPELKEYEENILAEDKVLKLIFNNLPHQTLFSCRLVNRKWNELATECLKESYEIGFQEFVDYFFVSKSDKRSLAELTNIIGSSKNFPCVKFLFSGGNLGNEDAQQFFNSYGKSIRSLKIYHVNPHLSENDPKPNFILSDDQIDEEKKEMIMRKWTDSRIITKILTVQAYNIETLEIAFPHDNFWPGYENLLFDAEDEEGMILSLPLSKLKSINFWIPLLDPCCYLQAPMICQILILAVNLSSLKFNNESSFDSLWFWEVLFYGNKIHFLKELSFYPFDQSDIDEYKTLATFKPQLESLELNFVDLGEESELSNQYLDILSKLLWSSQKTLKQIINFSRIGFLPFYSSTALVFENIKEIELSPSNFKQEDVQEGGNLDSVSLLPLGLNFSTNFPNLNSVTLKFPCVIKKEEEELLWDKYFPFLNTAFTDSATSVKNVVLDFKFVPLSWLKEMVNFFPNVENLTVGFIANFAKASMIIWETEWKLKYLKLNSNIGSCYHKKLDPIFTGFSSEDCKILLYSRSGFTKREMKENRENPSIVNLKELEKLEISLCPWNSFNISKVTGIYAFNQMKKLKEVCISLPSSSSSFEITRMEQKLKPLAAYKVKLA